MDSKGFGRGTLVFLLAFIAIVIITLYLRMPLLKDFGFYEPDGFYHYSVIRYAVNHGFRIPKTLGISGWPNSAPVGEPDGLYWVTLLPYALLMYFGVSYYTVMRLVPLLFALFDVVGAYYLSRFISKDKFFGLLVMALVALSSGDAARTSALIYRGDGFVTIFLIVSLIFAIKIFDGKNDIKKKILFAAISGISLSICNLVWNGAPFVTVVYALSIMLIMAASFILEAGEKKEQRVESLFNCIYMIGAFFLWYILVRAYRFVGFIGGQGLTGINGLALILLLTVSWIVLYAIGQFIRKRELFRDAGIYVDGAARTFIIILLVLGAFGAVALFFPGLITNIFINNGINTAGNAFGATIQELTPPTYSFLYASFGMTLFTTPMSVMMVLSAILHNITVLFVFSVISFLLYMYMKVFDSGGWLEGKATLKFWVTPALLIIIAYFMVTSYLQMTAIRFNSLISIPLVIFSAYTIYWGVMLLKRSMLAVAAAATMAVAVISYISLLSVTNYPPALALYAILIFLPYIAYSIFGLMKKNLRMEILGVLAVYALLVSVMITDINYGANISQADNINPQFINALFWMKNNTPANSVVLDLWPDGSVVEGVANRTSVTDSVGSQNASKADPFAAWLLNSSSNPQFLLSKINGKPDYLLVRYIWLYESEGIFQESLLNISKISNYGFMQLTPVSEYGNATMNVLKMQGQQGIGATLDIYKDGKILAYMQMSQGISPFSNVVFYNASSGVANIVNQTLNFTNNQTLLIEYSGTPIYVNGTSAPNIIGAYIFEPGFAKSNMFKFLFLCSDAYCPWNSSIAGLKLEYINGDSKIYRIVYNNTSLT